MSVINLGGLAVTENSYRKARQLVEDRQGGGRKTANDVLASLREMKPGWTISTSSNDWGEGFRNIEISSNTLNRMANDPEMMIRYKAMILDLEEVVPELEEWKAENPGQSFEFGLAFGANGETQAQAIVRTLMGGQIRTTFELPDDRPSWADLIEQKLESLRQGQTEDAYGETSWQG